MKKDIRVFLLALLLPLSGCFLVYGKAGSGPVSDFIVASLTEHGGSPATLDPMPEISKSWRFKKDSQGVQIFISGDHFTEVSDLLVDLLGDPDPTLGSEEISTARANEFGAFSVRDKGVAVQYFYEDGRTGLIIVRPQT